MKQLDPFLKGHVLNQMLYTCIGIIWSWFPFYKYTQKRNSTFYIIPIFLSPVNHWWFSVIAAEGILKTNESPYW